MISVLTGIITGISAVMGISMGMLGLTKIQKARCTAVKAIKKHNKAIYMLEEIDELRCTAMNVRAADLGVMLSVFCGAVLAILGGVYAWIIINNIGITMLVSGIIYNIMAGPLYRKAKSIYRQALETEKETKKMYGELVAMGFFDRK